MVLTVSNHVASILIVADITIGDLPRTDTTADVHKLFLPQEQGML